MDISLTQQLACAQRELALREQVYPRLVAQQAMLASTAAHELAAQRAIVRLLAGLLAAEQAVETLAEAADGTRP